MRLSCSTRWPRMQLVQGGLMPTQWSRSRQRQRRLQGLAGRTQMQWKQRLRGQMQLSWSRRKLRLRRKLRSPSRPPPCTSSARLSQLLSIRSAPCIGSARLSEYPIYGFLRVSALVYVRAVVRVGEHMQSFV
eukprot:08450_5